jgi:hypothetical protein
MFAFLWGKRIVNRCKRCRFHQLKLYPEEEAGPQSTKKPVVVETYDEIVFPEPTEAFFLRVQNHPAANVPRLPPGITLPPPGMYMFLNLQPARLVFQNRK